MTEDKNTGDRITKWIRWIARLWSLPLIISILIILASYTWNWITMGQADPYAVDDYPPIENLPPIFALLSIVGLGIAWRWETVGAAITVVFQAAMLVVLFVDQPIASDFPRSATPYVISAVIVIPGILFLVTSFRARKESPA